jgi:undecaprenyl-phosphate galactose phosphotransferase
MQAVSNYPIPNTFGIDAKAKLFIEYYSLDELRQVLTEHKGERILHIGQGSNLLFTKDFDGVILISSSTGLMHQDPVGLVIKRFFDILGGLAGLILLIPVSVYVKIQFLKSGDHESIFFTQDRIGYKGRLFKMLKYRSMVPHAEEVLEKMMAEDPKIKEEYEINKKLENDPRVTEVGERIRRKSIDELPQLLNVLKGDMSLVGPRPYLPRERQDMGQYYDTIILCRPGITGMWQTHGRSEAPFPQRLRFDDYYYRNWSIWLDLTILSKTFKTVNSSTGAM